MGLSARQALHNLATAVREVRATWEEHVTLQESVEVLKGLVEASEPKEVKPASADVSDEGKRKTT